MGSDGDSILVTGGAGFIGSNFISYVLEAEPLMHIVNLDKLTYAGSMENLTETNSNVNYTFIKGDICDEGLVNTLFLKHKIKGVIHFAAESHVDNSIENPANFIETNIRGTFTLLEAARKHWLNSGNLPKKGFEKGRFHHISTDEVYGSLGDEGSFDEETPYAPNSPYSASKAASDFLVRSYHHTYGLNVVTSNCSNNYGPRQHVEKLMPTIIRKALSGESIPIYGDGKNVRDWLYVLDHCKALHLVFDKGRTGETYVIGGDNEYNNLRIAQKLCVLLDELRPLNGSSYKELITFVEDRPGHDYRYAVDSRKIKRELGWYPRIDFDSGLRKTVLWYLEKYDKEIKRT